jgi:hypothetical protein
LFEQRYLEFFDLADGAIYDVENAIESAYRSDAPLFERLIQQVDYSGADKILSTSRQPIYIAERARKQDLENGYRRDPSLRTETPGTWPSEFDKWLTAYESGLGFYPGVMAFGVVGPSPGGPRFDTFAMIAMRPWLRAIAEDRIEHVGSNGTNAYYYPLDRLRSIEGCVLYEE